jgi:PleD family two-component response regulator
MHVPHPGSPWHLQTISVGVAVAVPEPGQSPLSLLNASDSALYLAKLLGRNRVESNLSQAALQLDSQEPELVPPGIA